MKDPVQEEIIDEFSVFDEWLDKYDYLIGLSANLSPTRANGLLAMIKQMRLFALAFAGRTEPTEH